MLKEKGRDQMKKAATAVLAALCLALFLSPPAIADMGPKDTLTITVKNPPQELYYLDLLYPNAPAELYENLTQEERGTLDQTLLQALENTRPEGWSLVLCDGTGPPCFGQLTGTPRDDGAVFHTFSYFGLPDTYRVAIVTASGESFVSKVCTRTTLQSSLTVDWAAQTVAQPSAFPACLAQFLATCLPTLLLEGLVLALFGFSLRKNAKVFLLVNLSTQAVVFLVLGLSMVRSSLNFSYYLLFFPVEAAVTAAETLLYARFLSGHSRKRAVAYGITANLLSAALGWFLAAPVWQLVSSLL